MKVQPEIFALFTSAAAFEKDHFAPTRHKNRLNTFHYYLSESRRNQPNDNNRMRAQGNAISQ